MAMKWSVDELVKIVRLGGGLNINASKMSVEDAVKLASHAAGRGSQITFRDAGHWSAQDALRIASFGKGTVVFSDS